jgi:hypothetical protein
MHGKTNDLMFLHSMCYDLCNMTKRNYHRMLYEAKQEMAHLLVQRQENDQEIARVHRVISELQNLCAEQDQRNFWDGAERLIKADLKVGITECVRVILRQNVLPMTAVELLEQVKARKYNVTRYKNPLAIIHTLLKRLVKSGDVRVAAPINGLKAYRWASAADKALSELQKSSEPVVAKRGGSKESK